ncbi:TIGR04255 family protein [Sphaerochaeta sp. PS]|uniref:TIGR04255 family protein n=1 Tax=Sphaerochaeta sp. PS TaxID=3076336 RepID=UPI0028A55367|nr:TIGR04255 family protein [Sphaerochaeta sp. PS]MDT4762276.1 TIGR04255 family protein [Sphaerochaeta sp. PS]
MSGIKQALPNGPLSVVLIQIQFSPIVQILKYIPMFQDYVRKHGYPLYSPMKTDLVLLGPNGEPENTIFEQWFFSSTDMQQTIILDSEKITFQVFDVQAYSFDSFLQNFLTLVKELDSIVDISMFSRLGLRYINSIQEKKEISWKSLVVKEFQGPTLPSDIHWMENDLSSFSTQRGVFLKDLSITSNFRLLLTQNPIGRKYPEGIQRLPNDAPEFFEQKSLVTYLDLDHFVIFSAAPRKLDVFNRLPDIFHALHSVIEDVFFESIITDEARKIWQ